MKFAFLPYSRVVSTASPSGNNIKDVLLGVAYQLEKVEVQRKFINAYCLIRYKTEYFMAKGH